MKCPHKEICCYSTNVMPDGKLGPMREVYLGNICALKKNIDPFQCGCNFLPVHFAGRVDCETKVGFISRSN